MRYLFGDSTESSLDFNYLAFLREVVDCAVVMVECDVSLEAVDERKRARDREAETQLAAVAEFGKRAAEFVGPVAEEQKGSAVGRCAAAVANSIRQAVEWESTEIRNKVATERDELTKDGQGVRARAKEAVEKLLRTHDLPAADKELQVVWSGAGVNATLRQRTSFGVEAVLALEIPPASLLTPDLRVDRVADGVEVHVREAGGWLKKAEKLVVHKLGRYHIVSVLAGTNIVVQLRADASAGELTITSQPNGDISIDASGEGREVVIEERDRAGLTVLVEKLDAATRALSETRNKLVSLDVDGKSLLEQAKPRVFVERVTAAIAPTVQKIKLHSRSSDELVLRRLIADNRREEIFVSIADLVKKIDVLPVQARSVFAPLRLRDEAAAPPPPAPSEAAHAPLAAKPTSDTKEAKIATPPVLPSPDAPVADPPAMLAAKPAADPPARPAVTVPMPDRSIRSSSPPPLAAIPEPPSVPARTKEPTQPFGTPVTADTKRPEAPAPPPTGAADLDDEEWPMIARDEPSDEGSPPSAT